jgi:hypothetical protein
VMRFRNNAQRWKFIKENWEPYFIFSIGAAGLLFFYLNSNMSWWNWARGMLLSSVLFLDGSITITILKESEARKYYGL